MSANSDRRYIHGVMAKTNVHLSTINSHDLVTISALQHREQHPKGAQRHVFDGGWLLLFVHSTTVIDFFWSVRLRPIPMIKRKYPMSNLFRFILLYFRKRCSRPCDICDKLRQHFHAKWFSDNNPLDLRLLLGRWECIVRNNPTSSMHQLGHI